MEAEGRSSGRKRRNHTSCTHIHNFPFRCMNSDKLVQALPVSETYCLTPPIRNVANTGEWSLVAISLVHPGNKEVTTIVNTTY